MPNHVKNVVKMEGITNLPLFVEEDGKRCFDFNKIILMPESLNIESGSMTDECAMYYLTEKCTIPVGCLDAEKNENGKRNNWQSVFKAGRLAQRNLQQGYDESLQGD